MAELHLVGTTDDRRQLLLATAPTGTAEHRLAADQRLIDAVRAAARTGPPSSALTPREIQAELRGGASLEEVAARAGVPPERLEPYATPVLSELARVLEDALAARMSRPPHGPSTLPLGLAVRMHWPADEPDSRPAWSARRDPAIGWVVEVRRPGESGPAVACWRWDRVVHSLAPLDAVASQLGHVSAPREGSPAASERVASPERVQSPPPPAETAGEVGEQQPAAGPRADVPRPARVARPGRRPAVPAWADVLLGVSSSAPAGPARPEDTEAAG